MTSYSDADLGWSAQFLSQLDLHEVADTLPIRIAAVHRDAVEALSRDGPLRLDLPAHLPAGQIAVGDWALAARDPARLLRLLDRQSVLKRRAAGTGRATQLIAANLDTLFLVTSCTADFNPADMGGGDPVQLAGGVTAACPTENLIVAAVGQRASSVVQTACENARSKPSDGMHTKIGTTGKLTTRGQIWSIYRSEGSLKGWLRNSAEVIKEDGSLTKLRESVGKASVLGTWVSFGSSGVRVAAGIELDDSSAADELVIDMKKGPLGKADESEPPNKFKQAMSQVANVSQNGAFWQYLEYRRNGSCAYCVSKIEDPEKANQLLGEFINPSRGAGPRGGGFGF